MTPPRRHGLDALAASLQQPVSAPRALDRPPATPTSLRATQRRALDWPMAKTEKQRQLVKVLCREVREAERDGEKTPSSCETSSKAGAADVSPERAGGRASQGGPDAECEVPAAALPAVRFEEAAESSAGSSDDDDRDDDDDGKEGFTRRHLIAAVAPSAGAMAGGAAGSFTGTVTGSLMGAAAGVPTAIFTFGLSVPLFSLVGGVAGFRMGGNVGCNLGEMGGQAISQMAAGHRDGTNRRHNPRSSSAPPSARGDSRSTYSRSTSRRPRRGQ